MPKYTRAPAEVSQIAKEMLEEHFSDLHELTKGGKGREGTPLTFDFIFAHGDVNEDGEKIGPAMKTRGIPVAGEIRAMKLKDRAAGRADVEITIDGDAWSGAEGVDGYTDQRKRALIHHEIYHLEPRRDKDGNIKRDDLGRVLFRLRPHDWEIWGFAETAKLFGDQANEVSAAHHVHRKYGQILFSFMGQQELTVPDQGQEEEQELD